MPKTPLEKINAILDKMSIPEQLDCWRDVGDAIHQKIEDHKNKKKEEIENLNSLQKEIK